jgi:DnaJ family protein C protein 27
MSASSTPRSSPSVPVPPPRTAPRLKILSVGSSTVGKSCLIKRYCEKKFLPKYISTIGVDFGVRSVQLSGSSDQHSELKINFFDLSGSNEFYSIRQDFYSETQCLLLCFDVTNSESYQNIDNWALECKEFGGKPLIIALIACKCDLKEERKVSEKEAKTFAQNRGYLYFETSAADGGGVNEMFQALFLVVNKKINYG